MKIKLDKKTKIVLISLFIFLAIGIASFSLAYFDAVITGEANENLLLSGDVRLNFTDETSISIDGIYPGDYIEKTFSVENIGTIATNYDIGWEELENTFINNEIHASMTCTRYVRKDDNSLVQEGTCTGVNEQPIYGEGSYLKQGTYIEPKVVHTYHIKIEFIETDEDQSYNKDKVFNGKIKINGSDTKNNTWYNTCNEGSTLLNCKMLADNETNSDSSPSRYVTSPKGIDFTKISSDTNGKGLYYTTDSNKTENGARVYYYRGNVLNNHVIFENKCYRIIRTNEDGSVKLRYNGTPTSGKCPDKIAVNVGKSSYNNLNNDNAYVGYMYGVANSANYKNTHANTNSSTVKQLLDNWYKNNLLSENNKIHNTMYCVDRSYALSTTIGGLTNTKQGFKTNTTMYGSAQRFISKNSLVANSSHTPKFNCENELDKFTLKESQNGTNNYGNNALDYSISLLTADEVVYAGGKYKADDESSNNTDYYLYTSEDYWTVTPGMYNGSAKVIKVNANGSIEVEDVASSISVIPVISLNPRMTVKSGNGTKETPYVLELQHQVHFKTNYETAGTITPETQYVVDGESALANVNVADGYTYSSNSCGATYNGGSIVLPNVKSNTECLITFTPSQFLLTYDNNQGTGCFSKPISAGSKVGTLCTPNRHGYTFDGWYDSKDFTNEITSTTIASGNITVYAKWIPNVYILTYDNNTGSGCESKDITFDAKYGTLCTPVKPNYTFVGWFTGLTDGTKVDENTITTGDATVYAHFTPNIYTLTYDTAGGEGCTVKNVTYDSTYGTLCKPIKEGYQFVQWHFNNPTGDVVKETDIVKINGSTTIYAEYIANKYTLTYNYKNGVTGLYSPKNATFDQIINISNPKKDNYTFTGWQITSGLNTSTAKHGTTKSNVTSAITSDTQKIVSEYFKSLTSVDNGNVTLTATWKDATPPIMSFGINGLYTAVASCQDPQSSIVSGASQTYALSGTSNQTITHTCTNSDGLTTTESRTYTYSSCAKGANTCQGGYDSYQSCYQVYDPCAYQVSSPAGVTCDGDYVTHCNYGSTYNPCKYGSNTCKSGFLLK